MLGGDRGICESEDGRIIGTAGNDHTGGQVIPH